MRRNQDVPAKYFPVALHHRGVFKPISHYSLSALNSFSRFGLQRRQQNISIKKDASRKLEITWYFLLFQVNPFFRLVKKFCYFFDSEIGGFHNNLRLPNLLSFVLQVSIPKNHHILKLLFIHESNLTI